MFMAFCHSLLCIHSVFAFCSEDLVFMTTPSSLIRSVKVVEPRENLGSILAGRLRHTRHRWMNVNVRWKSIGSRFQTIMTEIQIVDRWISKIMVEFERSIEQLILDWTPRNARTSCHAIRGFRSTEALEIAYLAMEHVEDSSHDLTSR